MSAYSFTRVIRSWFAPAKEPDDHDEENSTPIKKLANKMLIDAFEQGAKTVLLEVGDTPPENLEYHQSPRCLRFVYEIKQQRETQFVIPLTHLDELVKEFDSMTDVNGIVRYYYKGAGEILTLRATKGPPEAPLTLVFQ